MRTICVVTGSRAEYGLLHWLLREIADSDDLTLQLVVTGMHLSPEFGLTYRAIESDGFAIDARVEMLVSSDTADGVAKSMGLGLIGFGEAFSRLAPDVVVLLGDRFEILAAASAATVAAIPIAHLHGGESTEGAFDEAIRHAITKMSHLHFVAAEPYRKRVVQLGEDPRRVFLVGAMGLDNLEKLELLQREELEATLGFTLGPRNLLVTFHPTTLSGGSDKAQLDELLRALDRFPDIHLIFTLPNADTGGRALIARLQEFVARRPNAAAFTSLGQLRYISALRHVDGVVGNSSSGLLEAPSMRKGTVNIGDRQRGRLKAASVIDCVPEAPAIESAISRLYSAEFQAELKRVESPFGAPGASRRVAEVLRSFPLEGIVRKRFFDIPHGS